MSKFDYNNFYSDDGEYAVFNARKYTKEESLTKAQVELDVSNVDLLAVESAWVRYGFGIDFDGERINGYWLEFEPVGNCVPVWAVRKAV